MSISLLKNINDVYFVLLSVCSIFNVFAPWYRYTWILSSITFGATTLSGMFAGYILRDTSRKPLGRCHLLALIGAALIAVANAVVVYQILQFMHHHGIYLKV